jgi:hypothetical protein
VTNISGRFMASHNGRGHWTILDTENSQFLFNVTPVGYTGGHGQLTHLPAYTTAEVQDLIKTLTYAADGVKMGGWESEG